MKVIKIDAVPEYWLGEKKNSMRRIKEVFQCKNMKIHVGIFPPKAQSSRHIHENSEEIVYVVTGVGEVEAGGETASFGPNTMVYIEAAVPHLYRNLGDEEMMTFAVYSPPVELPRK